MKKKFLILGFLSFGLAFSAHLLSYKAVGVFFFYTTVGLFLVHFGYSAIDIFKGNRRMWKEFFVKKKTFGQALDTAMQQPTPTSTPDSLSRKD
jgi:hypothetical protein